MMNVIEMTSRRQDLSTATELLTATFKYDDVKQGRVLEEIDKSV